MHPLRARADAPAARASARRPPSAWPSSATRPSRQLQEADEAQLAARFGDRWARYLKARASFHDDSPVETESGAAKSVSTERTFDEDIASHDELETDPARAVARALRGPAAQGPPRAARWRSRSGSPTGRRSRARARSPDATNDTALVTETAVELLRAYAPPQPVRLLGVRLAGFDDLEPDRPPAPVAPVGQLALPL